MAAFESTFERLAAELADVTDAAAERTDARRSGADRTANTAQLLALVAQLVAMVLLAVLVRTISRSIVVPLRELRDRLGDIADGDGDLTRRADEAAAATGRRASVSCRMHSQAASKLRTAPPWQALLCQGVAVRYAFIEQHKGTLDFETRLGHGTVFRITLPASGQ